MLVRNDSLREGTKLRKRETAGIDTIYTYFTVCYLKQCTQAKWRQIVKTTSKKIKCKKKHN